MKTTEQTVKRATRPQFVQRGVLPHLTPFQLLANDPTNFARIEKAFAVLRVSECSCCRAPVRIAEAFSFAFDIDTFGVCGECWENCEDLADRVDFSSVAPHDIACAWLCLNWTQYLAGEQRVNREPRAWRLAWSMACAFGEEAIAAALAAHPRRALYRDPSRMRYDADAQGLVPHGWRNEDGPNTPRDWRAFWANYHADRAAALDPANVAAAVLVAQGGMEGGAR